MSKSPSRTAASGSPGASRSRGRSVAAEPEAKRGKKEALTPQDTRSKLMHAAMRVFAREGFAAASTRMIATESGVNLQAITYHFGSKAELYRGVVQHIADAMSAIVGPAAVAIEGRLSAGAVPPDDARELVHLALANIARALLLEASDDWARIILREQMQPGPEFEILFSSSMGRMLTMLVRLTAIALDRDPADTETRARALAMLGQVLVFRMARAAALRVLGWNKIGKDEFHVLERAIRANVDAILAQKDAERSAS
ncbi:MAG: CerR family C-terminal domain-containing protein [Hyphomonadaceae bacterium]|nr:CerR family C-terminal domain-containing protein [Hyphomonadaceae bacterium]